RPLSRPKPQPSRASGPPPGPLPRLWQGNAAPRSASGGTVSNPVRTSGELGHFAHHAMPLPAASKASQPPVPRRIPPNGPPPPGPRTQIGSWPRQRDSQFARADKEKAGGSSPRELIQLTVTDSLHMFAQSHRRPRSVDPSNDHPGQGIYR